MSDDPYAPRERPLTLPPEPDIDWEAIDNAAADYPPFWQEIDAAIKCIENEAQRQGVDISGHITTLHDELKSLKSLYQQGE